MYLNAPLIDSKNTKKKRLHVIYCSRNNGNAYRTHDNKLTTAAAPIATTSITRTKAATEVAEETVAVSFQFQFIIKFALYAFLCVLRYSHTHTLKEIEWQNIDNSTQLLLRCFFCTI